MSFGPQPPEPPPWPGWGSPGPDQGWPASANQPGAGPDQQRTGGSQQWPTVPQPWPGSTQQQPTAPQPWPGGTQQQPTTPQPWPGGTQQQRAGQQWPGGNQQWPGAHQQWPGQQGHQWPGLQGQQWHGQEQYAVQAQPQPQQWEPLPQPGMAYQPMVAPKSPALSVLLSVFIPGLGSMINDRVGTGVTILILNLAGIVLSLALIGIPLAIGTWIWGLVDAYQSAQRWNQAHGIIS
jgi:TM2 domain-containing membrane protein YozV